MKGNDLLRAMNGIEEDFIRSANGKEQSMIRQHKRRRKLIPALIAAVITAAGMTAGVVAYNLYHKESVQKYLGANGEALISNYAVSGTTAFSNETSTLTIDALLYDGHSALAILTLESADPAYTFAHDNYFIPEIICDKNGTKLMPQTIDGRRKINGKTLTGYGTMAYWNDSDVPTNQCKYTMHFENMEEWNGETLYMRFASPEEKSDYISNDESAQTDRKMLDGMMISFHFVQNCEYYTLTAENGEQVWLSDFELVQHIPEGKSNDASTVDYKLIYHDGTKQDVYVNVVHSNYEQNDLVSCYLAPKGLWQTDTDFALIHPAAEIDAVEINGITYYKTSK